MGEETRKESGFDQLWGVLNRRKWLAILVFTAPFSASIGLLTFLPNIYRATTTVIVERQQVPEAFVRPTITGEIETRLHTITQEILSRSRLENLIARFDLYPHLRDQPSPEAVIELIRRDIHLELKGVRPGGRDSEMVAFTISYQGSNPQTVARVTNTLASFYIEENLRVREKQATGTAEFLRVQLQEITERLDEQERRVSEFKKRHIGELPQQMEANLATLERLNTQLRLNNDNQTRALERRGALAKQLTDAHALGPVGGPDATAGRIARLQQELTELRALYSDKYPDVIRIRAEIAALERQLAATERDGRSDEHSPTTRSSPYSLQPKQALSELEVEIKTLKVEENTLRQAIATYQRRVENAPKREQEFQELSRDYETTKELYRSLLKRYDEAQLAESLEQRQKGEQFRILDSARVPEQPAAPYRGRLALLGLLLSFGLAVGGVMIAERLDTSFHVVDELRTFAKLPVLMSIPRIVTKADLSRMRWRLCLGAAVAAAGLALIIGATYLLAHGNEQLVLMLHGSRP